MSLSCTCSGRRCPFRYGRDLDHFPTAVYSGFVALAVVAEALVAATVGARARRHRPVLIPLAVFTTGFLATGITQLGLNTAGRCVDLYATRPPACFKMPDAGFTAGMLARNSYSCDKPPLS